MRVAVMGASGKVGRQLTAELLKRGHTVTALVHSSKLGVPPNSKLHVVSGDIHSSSDIAAAIKGSDAIVSTLGSWGTKSKDIVSAATKNLIPAMQKAGIKRFVSVTGNAAILPGENLTLIQNLSRRALLVIAKPILSDAEEHLRLLHDSDLDWTAIRSPVMTNSNKPNYKLASKPFAPWAVVSRTGVVMALADIIEDGSFSNQAPFIS